jgi:hypothetical protein
MNLKNLTAWISRIAYIGGLVLLVLPLLLGALILFRNMANVSQDSMDTQSAKLVGRWMYTKSRKSTAFYIFGYDRFGESVFTFQADGSLVLQNLADDSTHVLSYKFLNASTIEITGDSYYEGDMVINISDSGDSMAYTPHFKNASTRRNEWKWGSQLLKIPEPYNG